MSQQKNDSDKLTKYKIKGFYNRHKKKSIGVGASALILSVLTFSLAFAKDPSTTGLKEIYHIYNGNEYIGAVADSGTLETLIDMKKEEASNQFKDLSINAGSNISVIPEQVYTVSVNEEETLTKLEQSVEIEAEAQAFVVNGVPVAYIKDEEDFKKTVDLIKLKFVSQEQLDKLNNDNTNNIPLSEGNQTRIIDVTFNEEVKSEEAKVNPGEILTPEKAFELLVTGTLEKQVYKVKEGDVLGSIAKAHNLKIADLLVLNPGLTTDSLLKIDQEINVTVTKPYVNVKIIKEVYQKQEVAFKTIEEKDASMLKGETKVIQEGSNGKVESVHQISYINGVEQSRELISENILEAVVDKKVIVGTKVIPDRGTGSFAWPAVGGYVSSQMGPRWGRNHDGIDIARPSNYTIKASDNGRVVFTGWDGTYGQKVVINHNNGYETVYAHLSSITVSVGQTVAQGQQVGIMGSTGRSTGVHLHFEVRKNGALINPLSVLR